MKILTLKEIDEMHREYEAALAKQDNTAVRGLEDAYINSFAIFPGNFSDLIRETGQMFAGWTPENSRDGRVSIHQSGITFDELNVRNYSHAKNEQLKLLGLLEAKVVGMTNPQEIPHSLVLGGAVGKVNTITKGYAFRHKTDADYKSPE